MNFLKTKMSLIILLCTLLSILSIGSVSIITADKILRDSSRQNLQMQCENTGRRVNESLDSVSRSVDILSQNTLTLLRDFHRFRTDPQYVTESTTKMSYLAKTLAENTPGCTSVYVRYAPEYAASYPGFFWVRSQTTGMFDAFELTDITLYPPDDLSHVGWYYVPKQRKVATWMPPYQNENIDTQIVSYVVPLFIDREFVGVAGMDINFKYIQQIMRSIHIYSSGYAFLVQGKNVVDHKDFELYTPIPDILSDNSSDLLDAVNDTSLSIGEYSYGGLAKSFSAMPLHNGMRLFLCAPNDEIYYDSKLLSRRIVLMAIFFFFFITLIVNYILTKVLKLAMHDSLTHLPNRAYFLSSFEKIREQSDAGNHFSLFIMDIDEFKKINDTSGHNNGDLVLSSIASDAVRLLGEDTIVARWGGDEFIGLIPTRIAEEYLEKLRSHVESCSYPNYGTITVSVGVVRIERGMTLTQLTKAADMALYHSKESGRNRVTSFEDLPKDE